MESAERDALLTLMLTPGLGQTLVGRCIDRFGSARAALDAPARDLAAIQGISRDRAARIRAALDDPVGREAVEREQQLIDQHGVHLLPLDSPAYPRLLRLIPDPPHVLYVRGELRGEDNLALGVVGARRCSHYGREQADRLAFQCAQAGLCIVSGGAYGIDAAAHRAALRANGRTIAVIGSGLANPYPDEHAELFDQIAQGRGAVISELPMTAPPIPENFPRRNRLISGLALGVLVVEASNRSGALITARLCSEDHNREVMAVPGRVDSATSAGCHKIIREGWATLITGAADVLDALGEAGQLLKAQITVGADGRERDPGPSLFEHNLTDSQRRIVQALDGPHALDQLVTRTGLDLPVIQADLTMLEIRGLVARQSGRYVRKRG
jgi:DNA processing protein